MGTSFVLLVVTIMGIFIRTHEAQLAYDYYKFSCPFVESTVRTEMLKIFLSDISSPSAFVRLLFHDCQVQGCDASILLQSHDLSCNSEMESSRNFGVRKLDMINHIKSVLENKCPGQVSCADIIAMAAKESVFFTGGPEIRIPLGRKDSIMCSSSQQADANIPGPGISLNKLLHIFTSHGMTIEESVSMLGAHTLGVGHCLNIASRLYDGNPDDQMNLGFEAHLKWKCPTRVPLTNLTFVPIDSTPIAFDNQYFKDLLMGKALFGIDSTIARDPLTNPIVTRFATDQDYFFKVFSSAFVKLSSTKVLTAKEGEVRRQCYRRN
ncbi:hypothetical protein CsatA_021606 [Cannabis sativa]